MRWLARAINIVPVDPDANLVNAMQAGAAGLRLKKVLILFPEGERSIDGDAEEVPQGRGDSVGAPRRADRAGGARRPVRPVAARPVVQLARPAAVARAAGHGRVRPAAHGAAAATTPSGTAALRAAVARMFDRLRRDAVDSDAA